MTSPVIGTPWKKLNAPVSEEAIEGVDKYWRAANYLSIGQIYLRSNPLMKEPFTREDVKHRLVGHWGTTPGLNFLIGHINRLIADHQQNTVIIMGPGHGGPAGTAQSYLDGTYTETFPKITKDEAGLQKFFRQFSFQLRDIQSAFAQSIRQHYSRTSGMSNDGKVLPFQFGEGEDTTNGSQLFARKATHDPGFTEQRFYSRIGTGNRSCM